MNAPRVFTQRHPSERVTPVEVGDPLRWEPIGDQDLDPHMRARTVGAAVRAPTYVACAVDDVFEAAVLVTISCHGGQRVERVRIRMCQSMEDAQRACQDAEHERAWDSLSDTARALLQGLALVVEPAVAA